MTGQPAQVEVTREAMAFAPHAVTGAVECGTVTAVTINSPTAAPDSAEGTQASVGQGRVGRRVVDLIVLLTPLLAFAVPVVLVRAGLISEGFLFLNMASVIVAAMVAAYAHMGWHARPHGDGLLCARTLTGRRTVDLARLTKVGRLEVPGQTRNDDRLILTDAHGVRLIVHRLRGSDETVDALVRRALMRRRQDAGVVVSDRAAERLDLRAELARPHDRLRPGRKIREGLIGFLPLLSVFVLTPVSLGLTILAWILSAAE
ncbi:hypothetical protein JQK87_09510 [Streptomyces sp. G44]|uniref:hypothetical protein n=1 Tax=Streptomyces sp. G44 TaxID=2807632 RepID=UPI001961EBC9|nr:hypothetical protein [Streptomyces sp. G44]MBM7168643.1 hypothetical protein [Streptomyces sp. G44]